MAEPSPDQATLEAHLESVRFLQGASDGRWKLLHGSFPHLYVRVTGRDYATDLTYTHDFHLECTGFPATAPFVERWVFEDGPPHGSRPPAPQDCSPGFRDAMKDWGDGGGVYRAWQRYAAVHNDWTRKRPDEAWHRDRDLAFIMENLHALVAEQAQWLALRQPVPA